MKLLLIKLCLFAYACYAIPRFCYDKTEGFTILKIHSNLPFSPEFQVENGDLPDIFNQRFYYLNAGGQAYAFASEDGAYVIKFFKHHLRRLPIWLKILPLPAKYARQREEQRIKREKKLLRDFTSYKIAYELLPEKTGLLYLHLNKTNHLNQKIRIIDKIGIEHKLPLDEFEFVLQKKAKLTMTYFTDLIEKDDMLSGKKSIDSICELIKTRCQMGIFDEDPRIHHNVGFVEDKAILIDVGRLKKDPKREDPKVQRNDLFEITRKLQLFLNEKSPELAEYLKQKLCDE